jgi:hypothetical protein
MLILEKDFDIHPSSMIEFSAGDREKVKVKS